MERRLTKQNADNFMTQMAWNPIAEGVSPEVKLFIDSHTEIIYNEVSRKMADWVCEHYRKFMEQPREYDLYLKVFELLSEEILSRSIAYEYVRSVNGGTISVVSCIDFIVDRFQSTIAENDKQAS